jgi:putative nucleotidyltransferase with HDIG domain
MHSAAVLEQIEQMGELPILPQTLLQIQKVATDDRSSAEDLAEVILRDQALTVRVLRIVNSAMYQRGHSERVTTVRKAVITIGFETVRKLALGLSVFDMMSKLSRSPHLLEVARHSMITAAFAQTLAEASGRVPREEAFVIALVHDIGKAVLVECSPSDYDRVLTDVANGRDQIEAERAHFGMSHDRAGRRLAARWKLPRAIQSVIGDHHDFDALHPPKKMDPILGIIIYADAMSRFTGEPAEQATELKVLHKAGIALGISRGRIEEIHGGIDQAIEKLAEVVDLSAGDLRQYGQVVNVPGSVSVAPPLSAEEIAERTASQLRLYRAVGRGLAENEDPAELLRSIVDGVVQILGFGRGILFRVNRDGLRPWMWSGADTDGVVETLNLPLERESGALALCALQRREFHVPMADSEAYDGMAGTRLLEVTRSTGFACAPVLGSEGVAAVLFADHGPEGPDVVIELATELNGLASQAGLVMRVVERPRSPSPQAV